MKRATKTIVTDNDMYSISIHALVKRATFFLLFFSFLTFYFNPRPREEGDFEDLSSLITSIISIHALVKRATSFAFQYKRI